MKTFAFALLLIAAVGVADDEPKIDTSRFFKEKPSVIIIDGKPLGEEGLVPAPSGTTARYFVCPKDETIVRVTRGVPGELKCPLDGTTMKSGRGQAGAYFLLR